MNKKIAISLVGVMIAAVVVAGEVADWSVGGGTAKIVEASGSCTLTVDVLSATTISGSPAITGGAVSATTVTASGAVQGASLALSATQYFAIANTTQLVFVAGAVTNVIDADITSE